MKVPLPIQQLIFEYFDLRTLHSVSLVCREWCEQSSIVCAKNLYGSLALVSSYNNWRDLVVDKNRRNKPQVFFPKLI